MLSPETKAIQTKLGDYCRTGVFPDIPGIHPKHIQQYRRLIFNIVRNNISRAFPIAKKVIKKDLFRAMIHEFFSNHEAKTAQIWKLPGEFYEYAIQANWAELHDMPWLNDLLLFEWTELKVHTMPDGNIPEYTTEGDIFINPLALNPDYEIIQLNYPVHLVSAKETIDKTGNYYVLVFREQKSGRVRFINLSVFFIYLLKRIAKDQQALGQLLEEAYEYFNVSERAVYPDAIRSFVQDLMDQGFFLGYRITV